MREPFEVDELGNIYELIPFDDKTQKMLKEIDVACQDQMQEIKEEKTEAWNIGEEWYPDKETLMWLTFIKGFGIMYNRCTEAGWIKDVVLEKLLDDKN